MAVVDTELVCSYSCSTVEVELKGLIENIKVKLGIRKTKGSSVHYRNGFWMKDKRDAGAGNWSYTA